jgi:anti-sigma regulatory factor (Ser/Thr protein kinase)
MSAGPRGAAESDTAVESAMRIEKPAALENVPALLAFVDEACARHALDSDSAFAIRLAVDEVCVNLVRHAYAGEKGPIRIDFVREPERAVVTITDHAPPFDPAQAPAPDFDAPVEQRRIGGLGWHLVKHMIDHIEYRSDDDGSNRLTLVKHLRTAG